MSKWIQGKFKPKHPSKYVGNTSNICYRSWLEFKAMKLLDDDPLVESWASEEFYIPYVSPLDGREHRYFIDLFYVKNSTKYIVEIKPASQCVPPKGTGKRLIKESITYAVNQAKWQAAQAWATKYKCQFLILTEKDLGVKYAK